MENDEAEGLGSFTKGGQKRLNWLKGEKEQMWKSQGKSILGRGNSNP